MPQKPLKICIKVYTGAHLQDVGNEEVEHDFDVLVATSLFATSLSIITMIASELVRIHQRRKKIIKQTKQLKSENNQLFAREAYVKNFMDNYEELVPSSSSDDDDDSS